MEKLHKELLSKLKLLIPPEEYDSVVNQVMCEYEHDFLGFIDVYNAVAMFVPKHRTIIDFGCYLAAQAYFFAGHRKYIGVDVVDLKRFTPSNTEHYICSIQQFIKEHPELSNDNNVFAICSYVPDKEAQDLVRKTFKNCLIYYPSIGG